MRTANERRSATAESEIPKRRIVIAGDAQANGIAFALARLEAVASKYEVAYADAPGDRCDFFLQQLSNGRAPHLPRRCRRITFPKLRLGLLWPLTCSNPYNAAESDNPTGPFPLGDSFVLSSVEQDVSIDEIMQLLLAPAWNAAWPNLDMLFKAETSALLAMDGKCDVKIGSFVLKHFRKRRLFWAQNAPANELLCELTYRLLHACFGREVPADRAAIASAYDALSARDVMSHVAVPIHPLVAAHFGLEWYAPGERYPSIDGSRTLEEYYRSMAEYVQMRRARRQST